MIDSKYISFPPLFEDNKTSISSARKYLAAGSIITKYIASGGKKN
jgi:hypothetical protein